QREPAATASTFYWRSRSTENKSAAAALFQTNHEFCGMRAPVDWNHEGSAMRSRHLLGVVRDDDRDRYDEVLAEVATRVPGNRVRYFAHQILDVLVAGIRFLHAHQQYREHAARRGEIHDALARAGNADDPRVFVGARLAVGDEIRRSDRGRLLRGDFEVIRCSFDE